MSEKGTRRMRLAPEQMTRDEVNAALVAACEQLAAANERAEKAKKERDERKLEAAVEAMARGMIITRDYRDEMMGYRAGWPGPDGVRWTQTYPSIVDAALAGLEAMKDHRTHDDLPGKD